MMKNALITGVEFRGAGLRLPYVPELTESFGIDNVGWKVLVDTIFPNATTQDSVIMALAYCRKRDLDIFKRPVHIVPMWSTAAGKMIDTVWPSIAELRTTAFRTGLYAGREETAFGPDLEEQIGKENVKFPAWAQITVHRIVGNHIRAFPGSRVYWREAYAWTKRDDATPNSMWRKRPHGQIEKCAEAAALRGAFPEEIGNEYAAEEMEGQRLLAEAEPEPVRRAPAPPPTMLRSEPATSARRAPPPPAIVKAAVNKPIEATADDAYDFEDVRKRYMEAIKDATSQDDVEAAWQEIVDRHYDSFMPPDQEAMMQVHRHRLAELEP